MNNHKSIPSASFDQQNQPALPRHWGNTLPISINENGQPKYLLGPHYYVFGLALIASSIVFTWMGVSLAMNSKQKSLQIGIGCTLAMVFYIYQYISIGFSLPGIGSSSSLYPPDPATVSHPRFCLPCRAVRQQGTKHCLYCDICIIGYDHHCPWVGKCIGADNSGQFRYFLMSIGILFAVYAAGVYFA